MSIPAEFAEALSAFPDAMRALVEAELAAGNSIVEFDGGFPAPPVGNCVKLAKPLQSRPRESGDGLDFYERNTSSYSGEITDEKRHFFVLEPPLPPKPPPDMNAIRAALEAKQAAQIPADLLAQSAQATSRPKARDDASPRGTSPLSAVERFRESMNIDYERWREGIGYDLSSLESAEPDERARIASILLSREVSNWRDVQALAALDSPDARAKLREAFENGGQEIATAVMRYAPDLASTDDRTAALLNALESAELFHGLSEALDQIEEFHPPAIIDGLLRGTLKRDGTTAVSLAWELMVLHGKVASRFDWAERPFLLRFNTEDRNERETAFRELCERIGVDASKYLAPKRTR